MLPIVCYWSGKTGNTKRFVEKLDMELKKIPCEVTEPFILVFPTYGDGQVPRPVYDFAIKNRELIRGVVACGNRSFGETFAMGGKVISHCFGVPLLHKVELFGTDEDAQIIKEKIINESY